ncbi:HYALP Hyaluronidase, partial [Atractosteus spatula]|nr:HYALP Hyaluronidase [Atractosteus spatula]
MTDTLALGLKDRPQELWGYYLFPNCYNYEYKDVNKPYTGKCSPEVQSQNDQLIWLWEKSTALYPSVYLSTLLKGSYKAALFVRNCVQEAMRVAALPKLLNTLVHASCEALSRYLPSTLNPYIVNVTAAAKLCSDMLCQGNGRCVRKNYDSSDYLHLNPTNFKIQRGSNGKYFAVGMTSSADLTIFMNKFTCRCYAGKSCKAHLPAMLFVTIMSLSCQRSFYLSHDPRTKSASFSENTSFVSVWNAPSVHCSEKHNISLDLRQFSVISFPMANMIDQPLTIFYNLRLGLYPFIDEENEEQFNGGIPQEASLQKHLEQAKEDIKFYISSEMVKGLAVIDWENWRPTWMRNWGKKIFYRKLSLARKREANPFFSLKDIKKMAKAEFEKAAKNFMKETLKLGKELRPNLLWGFYLFPECYNHRNILNEHYDGQCPVREKAYNDELHWLWEESTALYPSIYFFQQLKDSKKAALFVRYRVLEAMRVAKLSKQPDPIPVYVYHRPKFVGRTQEFLTEFDLVNTIGEAAALGSAGVIAWGDMNVTESKNSCLMLKHYLEKKLNPYIVNVSTAAKFCSTVLCNDNGRCVRKKWNTSDYLHLDPRRFTIKKSITGALSVEGKLSREDINFFEAKFTCLCYTGKSCHSKWMWKGIPETLYNQSPVFAISLEFLNLFLFMIPVGLYTVC